jgi:hypothetical protein
MKFLFALCILYSTVAFAEDFDQRYIKCYETTQQTGPVEISHKFRINDRDIELIYPERIPLGQVVYDAVPPLPDWICLEHDQGSITFQACQASGQRIRGLIPVDINGKETVYCQKSIFDRIGGIPANS